MAFLVQIMSRLRFSSSSATTRIEMSSPTRSSEPLSGRIPTSNVQDQLQSPLFSTLYPELRNIVFRHALTEYDDVARPYSKHEYYYRPGFEFAGRIDTNLLLTCRLVYLETHLLPVSLNEHVFWQYRGPGSDLPGRGYIPSNPISYHDTYFDRMTLQQRSVVRRARFFAQVFWLESRKAQKWAAGLGVRKVTITIRHSDWWFWERSEPLRLQSPVKQWGGWVGSTPQLEELELEFETIDAKREQLEEHVRVALGWKFPLENGGELVHDGNTPDISTWMGSSRMVPGPDSRRLIRRQDSEATLDLRFPLDLKHHVRKIRFVNQSQMV